MIVALRKYWLPAWMSVIFALGLLSAINLASDIGRPYGGFMTFPQVYANRWPLDGLTPRWWPVSTQYGLQYGDHFVDLNSAPYTYNHGELYAAAYTHGDHFVTLRVERNGAPFDQQLPLVTFSLADYLDVEVPQFVAGLGFWLIAVVIYRARSTAEVNRVFAVAGTLIAGYQWLLLHDLFIGRGLVDHIDQLAWTVTVPFMGVVLVHGAIVFPTPLTSRIRPWLKGIYLLAWLIALGWATSKLLLWVEGEMLLVEQLDAFAFFGATGLIGLGMISITLRWCGTFLRRRTSRRIRRQLSLILIGLMFTWVIAAISIVGALEGETHYFWNGLDLRYLFLALPLSLAYVIVRYQTFRSAPPPLFVAVLVLFSSAFFASLGDWLIRLNYPGSTHSFFALIWVIIVIASSLWSAQGLFQRALSRVFHWEATSYSAVKRFGQELAGQADFSRLPQAIAQALVAELKIEQAVIWLRAGTSEQLELAAHDGQWASPPPNRLTPLPKELALLTKPIRLDQSATTWLQPLQTMTSLDALAPLTGPAGTIGLLGLGKRQDEEVFHDRDLEIVELIAQQSALFLLTARQIDELRQVPRRVTEAQERERFKIAQELHDTIQQFLGRLPFFLEVSRTSVHDDPAQAAELLQRCIDDVENAAKTVRQIRANLAPFQLQASFIQPVRDYLERFSARSGLRIEFETSPEVDHMLPADTRHALYRVIQQAVDNVTAHAQASQVTVKVWAVDSHVNFTITDDGVGSSTADRLQAEARGSFGLKSMRDRIESQGGEFEFLSALDAGSTVQGWLPAKILEVL